MALTADRPAKGQCECGAYWCTAHTETRSADSLSDSMREMWAGQE